MGGQNYTYQYIYSNDKVNLFMEKDYDQQFDNRWDVNEGFEDMYNIFGEENFEYFVAQHYGLNIKDKKDFKTDWLFDEI